MSNVIIGVLGVILFIGLAMAGANYLGPAFNRGRGDSMAATFMTVAAQTASAASARLAVDGRRPYADPAYLNELVSLGYLKVMPRIDPTAALRTLASNNVGSFSTARADLIVARLPAQWSTACEAIRIRAGLPETPPQLDQPQITAQIGTLPPGSFGCFINNVSMMSTIGAPVGSRILYFRI